MATKYDTVLSLLRNNAALAWRKAAVDYIIPPLHHKRYKGQNGRVAVIGGACEFTGAPFFSAMAALRTGVDLAYVFTTPEAAVPIKSYSPEIIVYPVLPRGCACAENEDVEQVLRNLQQRAETVIPKCDVVVIGPGLSGVPGEHRRSTPTQQAALLLLQLCMDKEKVLVIDADMIRILSSPGAVAMLQRMRGYRRCIFTPNRREFDLLLSACKSLLPASEQDSTHALPDQKFPSQLQRLQEQVLQSALEQEQLQQHHQIQQKQQPGHEHEQQHVRTADAFSSPAFNVQRVATRVVALSVFPSALLPAATDLAALPLLLGGPNLFLKGSTDLFVILAKSSAVGYCNVGASSARFDTGRNSCSSSNASSSCSPSRSDTSSQDIQSEKRCTYTAVLAACGPAGSSGSAWGSPKRSGGQGDLLNGVLAAFLAWHGRRQKERPAAQQQQRLSDTAAAHLTYGELGRVLFGHLAGRVAADTDSMAAAADDFAAGVLCAAYNASLLVRTAAARTFHHKRRGLLAEDVLKEIAPAFAALYEDGGVTR